jgi:hypothetical protein
MRSPWAQASHFSASVEQQDDLQVLRGQAARSSLGMLIERSTSAPPQSTGMDGLQKYSFDAFHGGDVSSLLVARGNDCWRFMSRVIDLII